MVGALAPLAIAAGILTALSGAGSASAAEVVPQSLSVAVQGEGTVSGAGIDCASSCVQSYPERSSSIIGFGHSGEEGYGATDPEQNGWMGLLSADIGAVQDNYGVGGAVAAFPDGEERPGGWGDGAPGLRTGNRSRRVAP